jgi:hypothetical protein
VGEQLKPRMGEGEIGRFEPNETAESIEGLERALARAVDASHAYVRRQGICQPSTHSWPSTA